MNKSNLKPFLIIWILNSLILRGAELMHPNAFSLGTDTMGLWLAVLVSGLIWTLLVWFTEPLVCKFLKIKSRIMKYVFYFLANLISLWIVSLITPVSGLKVISFSWIVTLAAIGDISQYIVWRGAECNKMIRK